MHIVNLYYYFSVFLFPCQLSYHIVYVFYTLKIEGPNKKFLPFITLTLGSQEGLKTTIFSNSLWSLYNPLKLISYAGSRRDKSFE